MKRRRELTCIAVMSMVLTIGFVPRSGIESQVGKNTSVLNPNLAGDKELLALPHLNAKLVKEILDKRPFLSMAAFHAFLSDSLGKEQTAKLYAKLFIPINLNTATEEEILLVPGVGKRIAHELEEYRPYRALAQFRREIGKYVDEKEVARLEQYVFVPINLNTASDEDILSIPGIGKRMLHEFKEYRPYKSLEQFRREIGKYVDKKELARFETYITLE